MTTTITTSVPSVTFSTTGLDVPDEADILAGSLSDWATALGNSMSKDLSTPQGQKAVSDTAIIADKNDQLLAIVNNINPDYASGRFQDAIGRIYFIDRIAATGTIVTATCSGRVGVTIPQGSVAQDDAGYQYFSLSDATIGADGTVDVEFQNQTTGPIACAIGSLNTIYKAIDGWSTVTNSAAGSLGQDVENRASFEYRRRNSVALNAKGTAESVYSAVLAVSGVTDAYVWSNHSGSSVNIGSTDYPVPAHSIYVGVYGGADADIAQAILIKNQAGCGMTGNTSYVISDTTSGLNNPPQYTITWNTVTPARTYFNVQIENNDSLPSDIVSQVKDTISSAFAGDSDTVPKPRIGSKIYAGSYYSVINSIDSNTVNVLSITIGIESSSLTSSGEYGVDQIPSLDESDISVTLV